MALHFGKREPETIKPLNAGVTPQRYGGLNAGTVAPTAPPVVAEPEQTAPVDSSVSGVMPEGGSKLTVGPNIKLKGVEITDCDTLVVEGMVEATMDSRVIQISQIGRAHV